MRNYSKKPIQTISLKKKLSSSKEGEEWRKANVDFHIDNSSYVSNIDFKFDYLYKIAAGHLDMSKYGYIVNPNGVNKKYNSRLRNYDIISPLVQMLMGEKSKRKSDPIVIAINSDIVNVKETQLAQLISGQLDQVFINELNNYVETGFVNKDISGYEEIRTKVDSIKDDRAIVGQQALSYVYNTEDVRRKLRESYYDLIVTAHTVTKKEVERNDVFYTVYSPKYSGYTCSENTKFIEDGESGFIKEFLTVSDIIDKFYDELDKDELDRLMSFDSNEHLSSSSNTIFWDSDSPEGLYNTLKEDGSLQKLFQTKSNYKVRSGLHEVAYVTWKSKVKIGLVRGVDLFGNPYEVEIDENYKPSPNEEVEWTWVNQAWEGYRIAGEMYKRVRPIPYQRGTFYNPSKCKLPINGMTLFGREYFTKSPVEKVEPHQEKYNIIHYHLEKVLNKNKDKLTILPKGLIPDDEDMDMFDMLYYADNDGFLFIDEVDERRLQELQVIRVLDLSLKDYLQQLWSSLEWIRNEAEDTLGINRQRKGQTFASDGKGMNEQAIFQSAIISEELFLEHEEFEEKEFQGLLDLTKYAWIDGKKAWFVDSDKRKVLLDIQGRDHLETEYSITVKNGREQQERLNRIRNNSQAFIQNAVKPSIVAKLEFIDNNEELIEYLEITERNLEQQQQQATQAEQEANQAKLEQEERHHQDKIAVEMYKIEADIMKSTLIGSSLDKNPDNDIQREEINIRLKELEIQREKIQADILINREKNQTALKNKVVGEKKNK